MTVRKYVSEEEVEKYIRSFGQIRRVNGNDRDDPTWHYYTTIKGKKILIAFANYRWPNFSIYIQE